MPTATRTEKRWFIHALVTIHLSGDDTASDFTVVEVAANRGGMPPLHLHEREDEAFFVLEGRVSVFVGAERIELKAGESAVAPRDVPHTYRVESDRARWLVICAPAGFERFVLEASVPVEADELPPADRAVDPAELARLASEYGIRILGPPGTLPG